MNVLVALMDDFLQRNPLDAANNLSNLSHVTRLCPVFNAKALQVSTVLFILLCRRRFSLYEFESCV